jgi:PIN domain nuclease of toxin-antitoxin system
MNFLLDTHAVIWFITEDAQLPDARKKEIEDPGNTIFVSIASFWEMGIKYSLGKLELKADLKKIFELIGESGMTILPLSPDHILTSANLDFHHRDPFDRIMIAQAKSEGLTILTRDKAFRQYNVNIHW